MTHDSDCLVPFAEQFLLFLRSDSGVFPLQCLCRHIRSFIFVLLLLSWFGRREREIPEEREGQYIILDTSSHLVQGRLFLGSMLHPGVIFFSRERKGTGTRAL